MTYDFKRLPEAMWFALVAVIVVVLEALVQFDPAVLQDWQTWLIGVAGAAVRAGAAVLLVVFAKMLAAFKSPPVA